MNAQLGLDGLAADWERHPPDCPARAGSVYYCTCGADPSRAYGVEVPPLAAPRAVEEFLSGFAAQFAYGPRRTAAQDRQAAQVGRELAERLAAFRAAGAA